MKHLQGQKIKIKHNIQKLENEEKRVNEALEKAQKFSGAKRTREEVEELDKEAPQGKEKEAEAGKCNKSRRKGLIFHSFYCFHRIEFWRVKLVLWYYLEGEGQEKDSKENNKEDNKEEVKEESSPDKNKGKKEAK